MMIFYYKTKKQLKENIGKNLDFSETSIFPIQSITEAI